METLGKPWRFENHTNEAESYANPKLNIALKSLKHCTMWSLGPKVKIISILEISMCNYLRLATMEQKTRPPTSTVVLGILGPRITYFVKNL